MTRHGYLLLLPLLAGCAGRTLDGGPTIADLARQSPPPAVASAADRKLAIESYQAFLREAKDPALKAEAMRRLADLTQEAREDRSARMPADAAAAPAPSAAATTPAAPAAAVPPARTIEPTAPTVASAAGQGGPRPAANPLAAAVAAAQPVAMDEPTPVQPQSEIRRVIGLYLQRLDAYPYHPRNDQVLYQLSRAYENDGQAELALRALDRMVLQYPDSPLAAEAQFRRGEILFVRKDYEAADRAYRAVLGQGPDSGFYEQSLYKRGWALFKQSEYLEGIDYFLQLVDRRSQAGRLDLDRLSRAEREQIEDTLRAISLSFAYLEGPDTVSEYFRSRGHRKDEEVLYRALGEQYLEKERYSDAAASFQAFVAAYPSSDMAPAFQLRAIEAFGKGGFPSQVLESRKAYVRLFDLRSPYWQGRDPLRAPPVVEQLKISLKALARHFHAMAQKDRQDADYALAADWYRRFLSNFPKDAAAQEMRFLLAELRFEHGDYPAAIEQYEQVAYGYGRNGRGADAGYAALQAYQRQADRLQAPALLAWQQRAGLSARRFAGDYPDHPKAAVALLLVAEKLFKLGDGDAAAAAAARLIALPRSDPRSRLSAWTLIGHTAFDRGGFLRAENAYQRALASPALPALAAGGAASTRTSLEERLAASIYKQAEQQRAAGDLATAADSFRRAAAALPGSGIAATAEFDAAAALIDLERWREAAEVLQGWRHRYPQDRRREEVTRRLAAAYLADGQILAAAAEYETLAAPPGDSERQRLALWQAAELRQKGQDPEAAGRLLQAYVARFPQPLEVAMEARQKLLTLAEKAGDARTAQRWRQALVEADAGAGEARSERTRYLAAHASLALALEIGDDYRQLRLREPLQRNLKKKQQRLERALEALGKAAAYGVAEVNTAASFAIAQLYADFGRALIQSERPASLTGQALEEYVLLLEEEATPFEEKAIQIHELNIKRAANGLYDQWVRRSYAQLAELVPARYAKAERSDQYVETIR